MEQYLSSYTAEDFNRITVVEDTDEFLSERAGGQGHPDDFAPAGPGIVILEAELSFKVPFQHRSKASNKVLWAFAFGASCTATYHSHYLG